jgi:hypothetical protein
MSRHSRLTKRHPELPEHDQRAADPSRSHLRRVDGHAGVLHTETDAHDESSSEQALPRLGTCATNGGDEEDDGGDEDFTSATEPRVERVREPAPDAATDEVDDRVDGSDFPRVGADTAADAKLDREGQIGGVGPGLVPALNAATSQLGFHVSS